MDVVKTLTVTISDNEAADLIDEMTVIYDRSNADGASGLTWTDWIDQFPVLRDMYEALQQ